MANQQRRGGTNSRRGRILAALLVAGLLATTATAEALYVAGAAHVTGANGESWRTDLEIHNPNAAQAALVIELLDMAAENLAPASRSVLLEGGRTAVYEDVMASLFADEGAGFLRVTSETAGLIVSARTYNETASGTFGQFIPQFAAADAATVSRPGTLVQLAQSTARDHGRRTNIGVINASDVPTRVAVRLYAASGQLLATRAVDLGAFGAQQLNDTFQGLVGSDLAGGSAEVVPFAEGAAVHAYASVVDNLTGDPVFVAAQ